MSVNKVLLIGHLGGDPEVKFLPSGNAVANFSMATNEVWTDKEGQRQERVEWHRVKAFSKLAEACGQYLSKGRQVYVEGSIHTRQYDDKDGVKRYITEITAQRVQFLGGGQQQPQGSAPRSERRDDPPPAADDDIPF